MALFDSTFLGLGKFFYSYQKKLVGLTALQLGALRTTLAAIFSMIIGLRSIKKIKKHQWKWILVSGLLGSFFPAFLFAFAELEIDSAIVSILNSTVPILSIIIGFLIFSVRSTKNQVIGVFVGLLGSVFLIGSGATVNTHQNYWYALLPLIATSMYAFNVHIIKKYLQEIPALSITAGCFIILLFPSLGVLYYSGFFQSELLQQPEVQVSIGYIAILSVVGTGIAKILFNRLVQLSNPVFTTSVTYLIPVVALTWGILDGEIFSFWQAVSGVVILIGVYFANKKRKVKS